MVLLVEDLRPSLVSHKLVGPLAELGDLVRKEVRRVPVAVACPIDSVSYQSNRCGFCFFQPSSEGKTVVITTRSGSPSNQPWTVSRHFL